MSQPYEPRLGFRENEADFYYYGLLSRPKLIARSSSHQWQWTHSGHPWYPVEKKISPVSSQHPLAPLWNDTSGPLRGEILQALAGIDWNAIDILRIGYVDDQAPPVILLVSVTPDSTKWSQGVEAATACRSILQKYGINDVHCELKEATLIRAVSPPSSSYVESRQPQVPQPQVPQPPLKLSDEKVKNYNLYADDYLKFSQHVGTPIAASETAGREGTKGVYLQTSSAVFALTCKHVVFDLERPENAREYRHQAGEPRQTFIQPGETTIDTLVEDAKTIKRTSGQSLAAVEQLPDWNPAKAFDKTWEERTLAEITSLDQFITPLKQAGTRAVGHVAFAPASTHGQGNRLADWALIGLHPDKHQDTLASLRNKVYIKLKNSQLAARAQHALGLKDDEDPQLGLRVDDGTRTVQLKAEFITEEELRQITNVHGTPDDHSLVVCKVGPTTGFTMGQSNGIRSVTRQTLPTVGSYVSEEWCIVGLPEGKGKRIKQFSDTGDSGSCVWDLKGRICGMVVAGSGHDGAADVSYATPMEWLMDDIKAHGFDVSLP